MSDQGSPLTDDEEREPSAAQIAEFERDNALLPRAEATPEFHPALFNISAGFTYRAVVRPVNPEVPDYAAIPLSVRRDASDEEYKAYFQIMQWNTLWEAGQFTRRAFDPDDLCEPLAQVAELGDVSVLFVPRTPSRYFEYQSMFHLLPLRTLDRFGLPVLRRGSWPFYADLGNVERFLPADFEARMSKAWSSTVWPHLCSGSRITAFSKDDPIRLLAHNLDFWLPAVTSTVQDTLRMFPEGDLEAGQTIDPQVRLNDGTILEGAVAGRPHTGGSVWQGEVEAELVVSDVVEAADATGRLRGILDAVRSNRVEDDFSARWSFAREDFERKLHRKRDKVQVRFVELPDTVPIQGPGSDLDGPLVTRDFLTMLNRQEREIVVLLTSGYRQYEIAELMGYAGHSAVAKKLSSIRRQAERYFEL